MDIFSYKVKSNKLLAKCGVEIYQGKKSAVVIVTELADNPGMSICNAFEDLFLQICHFYKLDPSSVLWIEHWGAWKQEEGAPYDRESEDWHKVEFNWNGEFVSRPHWINVTASFVEAAKSYLD